MTLSDAHRPAVGTTHILKTRNLSNRIAGSGSTATEKPD